MSHGEVHSNVKHYGVMAGVRNARSTPTNSNRNLLTIKNNGPNVGNMRFDDNCDGTVNDYIFQVGEVITWSHPCPTQALNFMSALGCTFSVIEGNTVTPHG